jgi:hypothetical protein
MSKLAAHVAIVPDSPSVTLATVSPVAAAIQKQVTRDFGPLWGISATVDAFEKLETVPVDYWPVIIKDDINQPGAAGFHTDKRGQPLSYVQSGTGWELTASHEVLEMLADPFGNRTIAGAPPPNPPANLPKLTRVTYLVEVCDPCEDDSLAYEVNGIKLSDFITPHYYDPNVNPAVQYSFRGKIKAPHSVLDGGYVSFGNPIDNHWYQIIVENGKSQVRDLGIIGDTQGKSLREIVDAKVREELKKDHYRTMAATSKTAKKSPVTSDRFAASRVARAQSLREFAKGLK